MMRHGSVEDKERTEKININDCTNEKEIKLDGEIKKVDKK